MTNIDLATSYMIKAQKRLKILDVLFKEKDYSDVIREAQEIVELSLKAILRYVGIDVPKIHDVGDLLLEFKPRFSPQTQRYLRRMAQISGYLRKERELAFYGDVDFIPTQKYTSPEARKAMRDAFFVVKVASEEIKG